MVRTCIGHETGSQQWRWSRTWRVLRISPQNVMCTVSTIASIAVNSRFHTVRNTVFSTFFVCLCKVSWKNVLSFISTLTEKLYVSLLTLASENVSLPCPLYQTRTFTFAHFKCIQYCKHEAEQKPWATANGGIRAKTPQRHFSSPPLSPFSRPLLFLPPPIPGTLKQLSTDILHQHHRQPPTKISRMYCNLSLCKTGGRGKDQRIASDAYNRKEKIMKRDP